MDKWLKKSIEVDDDESPINQKKEKSSQSKRRKVVRKHDDTYLKMGFTWNEKTRVHDALFVMNNVQTRACVQTNCFAMLRLITPS